jgi:lipid A 4'-phosphatase
MWPHRPATAGCDQPAHEAARDTAGGRLPLRVFLIRVLVALSVLLPLTVIFWLSDADLAVSRLFYGEPQSPWPHASDPLWQWLYRFGNLPGMLVGLGALAVAAVSLVWTRLRSWREPGLFLAALLLLGPGLLVNGIFKPHWQRSRPRDLIAFGGTKPFVHVCARGDDASSKSFPCGHASIGFYLMGPAFLVRGRGRRWAWAFLALGLTAGGLLGLARVIQGGHFASDVLWAGGMVYLTACGLSGLLDWWRVSRGTVQRPTLMLRPVPEPVVRSRRAA